MPIDLDVLVLPAFEELGDLPSELDPWFDAYGLGNAFDSDGLRTPLRYGDGIGVVPTGVGKSAAATTTATLCARDDVDLSGALVLSVGVAGGAPSRTTIGSVVVADTILDWDNKVRLDPDLSAAPPGEPHLEPNPYNDEVAVLDLRSDRVETARQTVADVSLATPDEAVRSASRQYDDANVPADPTVQVGTNCCGDELWHGREVARRVETYARTLDCAPPLVTEMEDAGTALALQRFGRLDAYLSVRGVANYDRPPEGTAARESFVSETFEAGFPTAVHNAVRVGIEIVDAAR